MKEQNSIPTSKVQRATQFVFTGAKVGANYIKYYAKKGITGEDDRAQLNEDNANDIYNSLSNLKGSALKVAQMLSMDKNILPKAYNEKFQMAQYSAPPLSYPLVVKTFQKYFKKNPTELFDTFSKEAVNAASIGQVHLATLKGKKLAVKVQYPGVAQSISSDLKMVKPIVVRMFSLNEKDLDLYMGEVESKLLEETDYELEVERSMEISSACSKIKGLVFPKYYPQYSSKHVITMDWIDGSHLKEFIATKPSQEVRNKLGQMLWDFYDFQVHNFKKVHADPHPGNFIITKENQLGIIDFGCVKEIPEDFYSDYFRLINKEVTEDETEMVELFYKLDFLSPDDTEKEKGVFIPLFKEMIELLGRPFHVPNFDFKDQAYFDEIYKAADKISKMEEVRKSKSARGSRHGLYINRTYFGLYSILNELGAEVKTGAGYYGKLNERIKTEKLEEAVY
jgi:predicted unusual protein kinase regulating ubiquinone biosynthesis (AarF/ABC1/UbiB family)